MKAAHKRGDSLVKRIVTVWKTIFEVEVQQGADFKWEAEGTYLGKRFQRKDSDPEKAVALWQKTAENRGD